MTTNYNMGLPVKWEGMHLRDCRRVYTFFDDFLMSSISDTADAAIWDYTITGSGTAAICDATDASQEMTGGLVVLMADDTASDVTSIVANGESFQIDQGYPLYFEVRYMNVDVSAVQTFIGLTASDATAIAGVVTGIGFEGVSTVLSTICDNAGSSENVDAMPITLEDGAWYRCAFYYDGVNTVDFYWSKGNDPLTGINSLKLTTTAHYVPQDLFLTPTIEVESAAADASADLVYVDYVLVQQARCRAAE